MYSIVKLFIVGKYKIAFLPKINENFNKMKNARKLIETN